MSRLILHVADLRTEESKTDISLPSKQPFERFRVRGVGNLLPQAIDRASLYWRVSGRKAYRAVLFRVVIREEGV